MKIKESIFGVTSSGETVKRYDMENGTGASISLISYGAAIQSVIVPDKTGAMRDILLGYDTIEDYEAQGEYFFGATIGRVANRIEGARFVLNGKEYGLPVNNGKRNCLHGGNRGFDKRNWQSKIDGETVQFTYCAADGEEGFPGALRITATYAFTNADEILIDYHAVSDADTIINITNHSYFNLSAHDNGAIDAHVLTIHADRFAESSDECLATGRFIDVAGTRFDFSGGQRIGDALDASDCQQQLVGGFDHSFLISGYDGSVREAASVVSPKSGVRMRVLTNKPSIHFYSGNFMKDMPGKHGARYGYRGGFCLETQYLPNAMRHANFPSIILRAGDDYRFRTVYAFSVDR